MCLEFIVVVIGSAIYMGKDMKEMLKLTAKETGHRLLTVNFQDTPDAHLEFDVLVKFDGARLRGTLKQERHVLLSLLAEHLDIVLRGHYRNVPV
jgi:hypothetical protein